jgi:hypothetical protein
MSSLKSEFNIQGTEYILCAAIWYKDLKTAKYLPVNTDKGVVVCGHRHAHCIMTTLATTGLRTVGNAEDGVGDHVQGFLTSDNRFVDRKEARKIAYQAGQTDKTDGDLYSEDIY